jgi:hypothetical protein
MSTMWLTSIEALVLGARLLVPVADDIPRLDPGPSCRAATRDVPNTSFQGCLDQENKARAEIVRQWNTFTAADRRDCIPTDSPSYIDLLTCLQMASAARGASTPSR